MVLDYYKLREQPFVVTPDSRYLFLSDSHGEALASLLYGIEAGCGFLALIASPGMGKTTLLFHVLNQLRNKARTVFLFQTIATSEDLLRAILADLGAGQPQGSVVEMQQRLNEVLTEQARLGKRVVVVIDEAQNLAEPVLELVRMLSNFETSREKLIQIILSGQTQLAEKIASPELVQLRQRISIFSFLKRFSPKDTELYIDHRVRTAGYNAEAPLFTREALALIVQYSEGIPRSINNLCFNALSLGCASRRQTIDGDVVREVVADLDLEQWRKKDPMALGAEERVSHEVPAFLLASRPPSKLAGWLTTLTVAVAIMLVLSSSLVTSHRWLAPKPSAQTNRVASELDAATISPSSEKQEPQPVATARTIRVTPGRTLFGICTEKFGTCNPEILQKISRLNPRLTNPDHIESGKSIQIPLSADIQSVKQQQGRTSIAERGTE
jgi:general secretion pathway protein A